MRVFDLKVDFKSPERDYVMKNLFFGKSIPLNKRLFTTGMV